MREVTGDLWTYPADFRVITTNGDVRADGCCVMGRGCAKQAKEKFQGLARNLGTLINAHGNNVYFFDNRLLGVPYGLFTFPVKHHWHERADLDLIRDSAESLARMILKRGTYVMPRPGCGNGGRTWDEVKPLLADLPDNVHVIDFAR